MDNKLKFIDLCCGIGGFHQALIKLNFECVFASDIDKDCQENYELNYGIKPVGDLTNINIESIPQFDILCAGFPCQPFSHAGNQKGFEDDRGNIFFSICNIIKYHKPKYIILENVKNLATHDNNNTWNTIKKNIKLLDYNTYDNPIILNTRYFGIPQSRERAIILCIRNDIGKLPSLPDISKKNIKQTNLYDIIECNVSSKYNIPEKYLISHDIWNEFINILNHNNIDIPKFPLWTDWWDSDGENTTITKIDKKLSNEENKKIIKEKQNNFYNKYKNWIDKNRSFYNQNINILQSWLIKSRLNKLWIGSLRKFEWQVGDKKITLDNTLYSTRGSGIRVKNLDYCPTLVAMTSMIPIFGVEKRYLTPKECSRLQSFSDNYTIHQNDKVAYKQFGNAVNVIMIERCARFLIKNENLFI
jgi:DNA (cytosine-5)-methyltransferase 1